MSDHRDGISNASAGSAIAPARVRRSDELVRPVLELMRRFEPEKLAALGGPGVADQITRLTPERPRERIAAYRQVIRAFGEHRDREKHATVRVDLEAMIMLLTWEADLLGLESESLVPYVDLAQEIFSGFLSLLTAAAPGRRAAAVRRRLRRYAGLEAGYTPLARQAEALIRLSLRRGAAGRGDTPLGPYRQAVLEGLRNGPKLLAAVAGLLEEHRITGTEQAFSHLRGQLTTYDAFLRRELLPRCRDDFRLPGDLYAARLLQHGVELPAAELSLRAEAAFEQLRRQLNETARRLARRRGWSDQTFPAVLRRLERRRIAPEAILGHYRRRHRQIEERVASMDLVTLPRRRHLVRFAGEAERAIVPFPHLRWPPFFGESHTARRGQAGELVLPAEAHLPPSGGTAGTDQASAADRAYATEAASWAVAAHEGVPGHALQISRLLDPDVSLARGPLGFNLAALEGWAVYAGSEISSELPLEARFLTLHHDLRRAAGAFLDPALHHGRLTLEQARCFLETRVGLSEAAAGQTLWRATVWSPGQATTYFYGHRQLAALRTAVECRLGAAFDRRRYHDDLLSQGLLPLSLLRRCVLERVGAVRRRAA